MELEEIKKLRKKHNLTQNQLAKLAGVSQSLVAKIEAKKIDPTFTKVKQIFEVLEGLSSEQELKAADIMTKRIISVRQNDFVIKAAHLMKKHQISQLPVLHDSNVVGLVSESSLLNIIAQKGDFTKLRISEVMDDAPPIVSKKTPVKVLFELLKYNPIIMIGSNGDFVGVVTKSDLLKQL